jgi:1-aminocyclopropane-1-carboxylate deaminase/D-cysteine desulfhydrase-like pyridoxal-dependent ACC family enzyme
MLRTGTSVPQLGALLAGQPWVALATLPTPLQRADRLSEKLERDIWIKRDDLTGLVLGGNKARKLEFSLGAARAAGADGVVTIGAVQSNHARSVAGAARVLGWDCHLVLGGERPPRPSGNLALNAALGAVFHFTGSTDWKDLDRQGKNLTRALTEQNANPVFLPMGGSTPQGALGFVAAYLELLDQCARIGLRPSSIVHATSTGATQAGLLFAHAALGRGPQPIGVAVAKTEIDLNLQVAELVAGIEALLGITLDPPPEPIVLDGYLGTAYGVPTEGGQAAFELLARTDAVLTDPVYSAKALHAVIDLAREDPHGPPIVFWHTGGQPALFSDSVGITEWPAVT